ncbi:hypothetical protein TOPH_08426 [Tolypocladium ophioglossoides CBS 100239]|uniref:Rap1 GTPase-GDP dissociation stimulator 1 n=1 Tax=Tolypocladium ophioglossoides (strain CBS 100239) TaxID=1163406 RepID=A0A0L0MZL6_TOLOC|nr:hypothetical protein TOPH_08426 [Tolypocladium ophioglossoides CBS 100239]
MTPQDIEALLQQHGSGQSQYEHDEASEPAGAPEQRTALLSPVLSACRDAWSSRSDELDVMAQKLGDGSRDVAWRLPFGESGILEFFLGVLAEDGLSQGLQVQSLRLVGNSCADTDKNRALVVQDNRLASVTRHLQNESLLPFTIPVLYNILVDFEPAQLLASQSRLSSKLVALLSSPSLSKYDAFVPYVCKILALLISQEGEASVADPSTVSILLNLATNSPAKEDLDDVISLVGVAVAYLANEGIQSMLITENHMGLFMEAFYLAHAGFEVNQIEDTDTATQLKQLRASLLAILADLSANDVFCSYYPLSSPVPPSFLAWIQGAHPLLQSAACLALGNLSRSDEASIALVERDAVHVHLIKLLSNSAVGDPQLLHSALSFLKNLAIPIQNKKRLGGLLEPSCVPRIYSLDTLPQVQFAAISLTRLLLVNCPPNVRRVCTPLSADLSSPNLERTTVTNIVGLFDRSDAEPTRLEASRSIAALCRVLHSTALSDVLPDWYEANFVSDSPADEPLPSVHGQQANYEQTDDEKRRSFFYKKHDLSKALGFLITQQKWPTLRSEAWFVFALMSRSWDGAAVIITVFQVHGTLDVLMEAITGRRESEIPPGANNQIAGAPGATQADQAVTSMAAGLRLEPQQVDPKQQANMAKVDRENALVLCTELLRNWEGELPPLRLSLLQDLVKEGTELVVAERSQA